MGENAIPNVHIHYHRPPGRKEIFVQRLVHQTADAVVTFLARTPLSRPVVVDGEVVLEDGSPAIWFTFPGAWHDIGRFHRADGTFTGIYANILTPVRWLDSRTWETTDLFLDLWIDPQGNATVLDEEEWQEAVDRGWLKEELAWAARDEALRLLHLARDGAWPPPVVQEWTLERVREEVGWP